MKWPAWLCAGIATANIVAAAAFWDLAHLVTGLAFAALAAGQAALDSSDRLIEAQRRLIEAQRRALDDGGVVEHRRPEGVRIVHRDGRETLCEVAYGGVDADGIAVWNVCTTVDFGAGDRVLVDLMPGRSMLVMPALGLRDGDELTVEVES